MIYTIKQKIQQWKTAAVLKDMLATKDAVTQKMATALSNTHKGLLTNEEAEAIAEIKSLREDLFKKNESLHYLDFGAGDPSDPMSNTENQKGKETERTVRFILEKGNLDAKHCLLLFQLVRAFQPRRILEMGTSLGISASYMGKALQLNERHSKMITLDGAAPQIRMAQSNFDKLNLSDFIQTKLGPFHETLESALQEYQALDFVYIDGHHDGPATLQYFEQIRNYCNEGALLVFDDIKWYESMQKAWKEIAQSPFVALSVDCDIIGICVLQHKPGTTTRYKVKL